jgi:hypothetical protein
MTGYLVVCGSFWEFKFTVTYPPVAALEIARIYST